MINKKLIPAGIGLVFFCLLGYLVSFELTTDFDTLISGFIQGFRSPVMTDIMKTITYSANWQAITLLCLVFLALPMTRSKAGFILAVSSIITTLLNNLMKQLFQRVRPEDIFPLVTQNSFSFPSGHAMSGLVFYGMVIYLLVGTLKNRPAKYLFTSLLSLLIILIGVSRVYLGVHYPSDILAGWSVGLSLLLLFEYAADRFAGKHIGNQG